MIERDYKRFETPHIFAVRGRTPRSTKVASTSGAPKMFLGTVSFKVVSRSFESVLEYVRERFPEMRIDAIVLETAVEYIADRPDVAEVERRLTQGE